MAVAAARLRAKLAGAARPPGACWGSGVALWTAAAATGRGIESAERADDRAADEWPTLWACIPPQLAEDLHTIHFTIPPAGNANHDHQRHAAPMPADAAT